MNAEQARELTKKAKQAHADISAWVGYLDEKIKIAAQMGEVSIDGIFAGVRMSINNEQKRLVREHYVRRGFTLTENVISWRQYE